jgi:putative glycosyltransferase
MNDQARSRAGETPSLSIVTTLYRSAPHVAEFHRRAIAAAEALGVEFELVYVNDGSPDDALERVLALARADPRVVVVDLSRNFGHHLAYMAGLQHARGARIFFIDVDLEEQPEWLAEFWAELDASGADMVYGHQVERGGGWLKRSTGRLFYGLFNRISDVRIPINPCTVRLMTRRYAAALETLRDRNLFLAGNYAWTGFEQRGLPVRKATAHSITTYGPVRLLKLFVNAVASFSAAPLRLIFFVGLVISSVSALLGFAILVRKLIDPSQVLLGWASVMTSIWFLGGTIILICGVLGIYISMIFGETKHRPPYLVRDVVRRGRSEPPQ